ncbi:succinylglutamate desuccinylase/aspartoacylase family protein [Massilia sp. Dwa41.01b]|uniref:succinylglutamate desuccinylase/aspartoacylase family protein n=1 Tax=unclassified Massilia TaxID=2609279 RepID=UPI0016041B4B|nr:MULTISPECIES: succinylglutamate desuccinylase/aspartoacylase family protein [unclassified Massilia]QNA90640.1 succinylglutamate desuccinylase/aspartoacylase family protein [Massilia sp. Dwa41.01b]QNA97870.1 succinylglutamate desuccinylase/aspartoacylase family protein [Massilia sp. Se16.2.3]
MHATKHPIAIEDNVATFQLTSYHYGQPGRGKKVYIQASLHADEVPAMLVAHFLRQELERLDAEGRVKGEIILVPAANPIGLSQTIHGTPFGRYDLSSGVNFNRAYKHVAEDLKQSLEGKLGEDAAANVALIRAHARRSLETWEPKTSGGILKKTLLSMAIDADIMLDLHCDNEAVLHMYAGEPLAEQVGPLAALLQSHVVLLARESGGEPFDEACSRLWWDLAEHFGQGVAIPPACVAVTVELRGENDVDYGLARPDAGALLQYLAREGVLDLPLEPLPAPLCAPTPLEAVEPLSAPHSGVLVFLKRLGDRVAAGEAVAEIVNPVSGQVTPVCPEHAGIFFASTAHRHLLRGMHVCKIAGDTAFRAGSLLSAR